MSYITKGGKKVFCKNDLAEGIASIDFVLLLGVQIGLVVNSPHPTPIIANFQNGAEIENRSAHQKKKKKKMVGNRF